MERNHSPIIYDHIFIDRLNSECSTEVVPPLPITSSQKCLISDENLPIRLLFERIKSQANHNITPKLPNTMLNRELSIMAGFETCPMSSQDEILKW